MLQGVHFKPSNLRPNSVLTAGSGGMEEGGAAWREAIARAMKQSRGNKSRAAAALGVTRKTLYKWLKECEETVG